MRKLINPTLQHSSGEKMTEKAISILEDLHLIEKQNGEYNINVSNVCREYITSAICLLYYTLTTDPERSMSWYKEKRKDFDDDKTLFATIMLAGILGHASVKRIEIGIPEEQARRYDRETVDTLVTLLQDMYSTLQEQEPEVIKYIKAVNQAFRVLIDALYMVV